MKKLVLILLTIFVYAMVQAQIAPSPNLTEAEADNLRAEFQQKSQEKNYQAAMEKAVQVNEAFLQQKRFKEAASICYQMDQLINESEKKAGKANFEFRFMVANSRLRLYTREGKPESSKHNLGALQYCMSQLKDESRRDEMLLSEAEYYSKFDMPGKSLERYKELLRRCVTNSTEDTREDCYKNMLGYAERNKITPLTKTVQEQYTTWQDSIKMVRAARELETLQQNHQTLQQDLQEKEKTISNNKIITIGLWTVIVILIAALVFFLIFVLRNIYQIRKLKNSLKIANESNAQKSHFISNINTQITPSLDNMESAIARSSSATVLEDNIVSLRKRIADMQTYISLEETREESYPISNVDIKLLCENIMIKAKSGFRVGIEDAVAVPRVNVKTNAEALDQVLSYLLERAAFYTESGKISLEFKKRNARTGQFIITDTGATIDPEKQEELFKPFGEDPDAPQFDWLLPICQLMAYKLNGTLKVDTEYKKGTRFVLDLCS
ncbi:HAMP domain-containing sensor histidine kinase [Bacteroides sp. 519]|uniref:sensor histidine kinase n=1 Tax=Bacteroides sp. 519 TaxID=2302937 RepID=UPI0013D600DE|nr:ATP-binding protein [Bacteroides sp. 519]NDV59408.1 sensor histidine kinase [Bacteroides sp. 519]